MIYATVFANANLQVLKMIYAERTVVESVAGTVIEHRIDAIGGDLIEAVKETWIDEMRDDDEEIAAEMTIEFWIDANPKVEMMVETWIGELSSVFDGVALIAATWIDVEMIVPDGEEMTVGVWIDMKLSVLKSIDGDAVVVERKVEIDEGI